MDWPPTPGFFKLRLVRRGPWVPARIERDETGWTITINRVVKARHEPDVSKVNDAFKIWETGKLIPESEYNHLVELADWAAKHSPSDPANNPSKPIDLSKIEFF